MRASVLVIDGGRFLDTAPIIAMLPVFTTSTARGVVPDTQEVIVHSLFAIVSTVELVKLQIFVGVLPDMEEIRAKLLCVIHNVDMVIVQDPINVPVMEDIRALIVLHLTVTLRVKMEDTAGVQIFVNVLLISRVLNAVNVPVILHA